MIKTFIWKIRFCLKIRKLLKLTWGMSWQTANANFEMLENDLNECPIKAAQDEYDAWDKLQF